MYKLSRIYELHFSDNYFEQFGSAHLKLYSIYIYIYIYSDW